MICPLGQVESSGDAYDRAERLTGLRLSTLACGNTNVRFRHHNPRIASRLQLLPESRASARAPVRRCVEMDEEDRSLRIRAAAVRWTWTSVAIGCFVGPLLAVTAVLGWWDASAMCLLGLVTGLAISYVALDSEQNARVLFYAMLAMGLVVLPALATFLGWVAASRNGTFTDWNATLTPFVVYALVTTAFCLMVARIWRPREVAEEARNEQVEQLAEWQVLEGEGLTGRPVVELTPPAQPPAVPPAQAQGG